MIDEWSNILESRNVRTILYCYCQEIYLTALIKGIGNWIQMDTIKTSNSHNLSTNDLLKDVVYLGLDFIFWKIWKIITFHALLKSGGCCLFLLRCAFKVTFLFEHNRLHDTHFDQGSKKRDSIQVLPNCPVQTQMARLFTNIFHHPIFWRGGCPCLSSVQNSVCHSLGHLRVFTFLMAAQLRDARSTPSRGSAYFAA